MKLNRKGFTLLEMLIVIAIVAVLISVAVPVLSSQLERSREAVDLANVRSAYAQVSTEALLGNTHVTVTVNLKQKQAGWQSVDPVNIGGIVHSKSVGDTDNWQGDAAPDGTCKVTYDETHGVVLTWSGTAAPIKPNSLPDTSVTGFFVMCYIKPITGQVTLGEKNQISSLTPAVRTQSTSRRSKKHSKKARATAFCSRRIAPGLF